MFIKKYFLALLLFVVDTISAQNAISLYPYKMDPVKHPDALRYHVKTPDAATLGNQMQFISLRDLSGPDYKERIERWVNKDKLGNILWPAYPLIYQDNLKEVVAEIKKRNLYLFDLWGYVPGSGPGGVWQQFVIPPGVLDLFRSSLGDHWLGMDVGEQDGRYVGGFAPQMLPMGTDHQQQYFNFQRHFQHMGDELGNKLSTLVSLNFGHYLLKEGVYSLIGAETAQGLPNTQVYYSFIRGAGKQYGVNWFGNASVWNRWGYKTYATDATNRDDEYDSGGPLKGTSLSLLKRLMYHHIFYNCVAAGFESSMYTSGPGVSEKNTQLSPIGKIQQEAVKWSAANGDPGTMYTPVALMTDFFAGWSFPRHLYSGDAYKTWGNLPYVPGDYLMDNMLDLIYPGYQDASYYKDERGFIAPTPYGDIADCLLSDAPLWLLQQYPVLVIAGELRAGEEINDKLENYVQKGGHLIITAGSLKNLPHGIAGIQCGTNSTAGSNMISYKDSSIQETVPYTLNKLSYPATVQVLQKAGGSPAIVHAAAGKGQVSVIATSFGIAEQPQCALPVRVREEKPLDRPFPLLHHVKAYLEDVLSALTLFKTNPGLSLVTCVKDKNEYNVLITNGKWTPQDFSIRASSGDIVSIKEIPVNSAEMSAIGYQPKVVTDKPGKNNTHIIAGGAARLFNIRLKNTSAVLLPEVSPTPNKKERALPLRNIIDIKEAILSRPTFFAHYDRVVVDWRYLQLREKAILKEEASWIGRQQLKITVDLSTGIDLFTNLRIVNNDSLQYEGSLKTMKDIIDKMSLLGADKLLLGTHKMPENNYTDSAFETSVIYTFQLLADYAAAKGIRCLLRSSPRRMTESLETALTLVKKVDRQNFSYAAPLYLLLKDDDEIDKNIKLLQQAGVSEWLVAAPQRDMHNQLITVNAQVRSYENKALVKKIFLAFPDASLMMDALYNSYDEEYLDIKAIEEWKDSK